MEKVVQTLSELHDEATRLVGLLSPSTHATLITLSGELGAGKTAFTKAIAHTLGVDEVVSSPTFVLEKIYKLNSEYSTFVRLIHIDAYRLEEGSDLAPLQFHELMQDTGNLILLEWPEKVADALPTPAMKITLTVRSDGSRSISYEE